MLKLKVIDLVSTKHNHLIGRLCLVFKIGSLILLKGDTEMEAVLSKSPINLLKILIKRKLPYRTCLILIA